MLPDWERTQQKPRGHRRANLSNGKDIKRKPSDVLKLSKPIENKILTSKQINHLMTTKR